MSRRADVTARNVPADSPRSRNLSSYVRGPRSYETCVGAGLVHARITEGAINPLADADAGLPGVGGQQAQIEKPPVAVATDDATEKRASRLGRGEHFGCHLELARAG
jgi:hypothetical protein